MPGLAYRRMKMKHVSNALRMILAAAVWIGPCAMHVLAAPADQPKATEPFKNLEFRETWARNHGWTHR